VQNGRQEKQWEWDCKAFLGALLPIAAAGRMENRRR